MPGIEDTMPQEPQQQDFRDICQFFATGGGDNSDDEAVWAALASHVSGNSRSIQVIYSYLWTATL
jgi:hypothetical protein